MGFINTHRKRIICCAALLILIGGGFLIVHRNSNTGYSASLAMFCTGQEYTEEAGVGYLTFTVDYPDGAVSKRIEIDGLEIEETLSASDAGDVIGLLVFLDLPDKVISENHLDTKAMEPLRLLTDTDRYDDYFRIVDISMK